MSRFFLNLRSVAYDNPLLLPRGTTGFALDTTSPQMLMAKIMRRKPVSQNAAEDPGTRHPLGEADRVEVSKDRISMVDINSEAGREVVESRDREFRHSAV